MTFDKLNLTAPIMKAIKSEGYEVPTDIQYKAIPYLLKGKDLVGCAQTGTGKTAAFAIPILQILAQKKGNATGSKSIKALILTPTRELAIQISQKFTDYAKYINIKNCVICGGVSQRPQVQALRDGAEVLIATPGRLLDLINQRFVKLNNIQFFILDEADTMLDMGFINDVKKIIAFLPKTRQTALFSATMPAQISKLSDSILTDPVRVAVNVISSTVDTIEQSVYFVGDRDKKSLLISLLKNKSITSALIFSRTKHGADRIVADLLKSGVNSQAIHGNKSQGARQIALNNFKNKKIRILVATDIAARGIDVEELSHVINYDLPNVPETYVHRIGRTGRAGLGGVALSFCDIEEKPYLKDIEKLIAKQIHVVNDHPYPQVIKEQSERKFTVNNSGKKVYVGSYGGRNHRI